MKLSDNPLLSSPEFETKFKIMRAIDAPLDKLSVKDICQKAGISRDTFYRHFSSKYDIAIWHGKLAQSLSLDQPLDDSSLVSLYARDLSLLAEEKDFYRRAFANTGKTSKEFPEMNLHRRTAIIDALQKKGVAITDRVVFQVETFVALETALVVKWLRTGCEPAPQVYAEWLVSMIPPELRAALEEVGAH